MFPSIINLTTSVLLAVTSGDLLYLYFAGAWHDSSQVIEYLEIFLLLLITAVSSIWSVKQIKELFREY